MHVSGPRENFHGPKLNLHFVLRDITLYRLLVRLESGLSRDPDFLRFLGIQAAIKLLVNPDPQNQGL